MRYPVPALQPDNRQRKMAAMCSLSVPQLIQFGRFDKTDGARKYEKYRDLVGSTKKVGQYVSEECGGCRAGKGESMDRKKGDKEWQRPGKGIG